MNEAGQVLTRGSSGCARGADKLVPAHTLDFSECVRQGMPTEDLRTCEIKAAAGDLLPPSVKAASVGRGYQLLEAIKTPVWDRLVAGIAQDQGPGM
jgi:hypothetical protein